MIARRIHRAPWAGPRTHVAPPPPLPPRLVLAHQVETLRAELRLQGQIEQATYEAHEAEIDALWARHDEELDALHARVDERDAEIDALRAEVEALRAELDAALAELELRGWREEPEPEQLRLFGGDDDA